MNRKILNKNSVLILLMIFIPISFSDGGIIPFWGSKKEITLEKVEDLRLNMIEKRNPKALIKLISIYDISGRLQHFENINSSSHKYMIPYNIF